MMARILGNKLLSGRALALPLAILLLIGGGGCNPEVKKVDLATTEPAAPTPLRLLVVDDAPLAEAIKRQWLAHTESALEVIHVTETKAAAAEHLPGDVVIYPPALVGQFAAADLLLPIEESLLADPEYGRDEILPLLVQESKWGHKSVSVPLGSPQLVLLYRADLLLEAKLSPPDTWDEYEKIVKHFAQPPGGTNIPAESWLPAAEPLADGWGARLLLARAAAGARHRDQLSSLWKLADMEPLIAGPPWVRALEQLQAVHTVANSGDLLTPDDCLKKFLSGECPLAITWPQALAETSSTQLRPEQIGQCRLPGSREAYDPDQAKWEPISDGGSLHVPTLGLSGRLASISRASSQPRAAARFLVWLSGPAVSGRVAPASAATTVFRTSHFRNGGSWQSPASGPPLLPAYGELLSSTEGQSRYLLAPRIPGQSEYLAALDEAVLAVVQKKEPVPESLEEAATEWREITKRRGLPSQRRALRQSLGLEE